MNRLASFLDCRERAAFLPRSNATIDKPLHPEVSEGDRTYFARIAYLDTRFVAEVRRMCGRHALGVAAPDGG
jgi:hypothetical protein